MNDTLFMEKPPNLTRIPEWDLNMVLKLLQSDSYKKVPPDPFFQWKKTFLMVMAMGIMFSESAHMS